MIVHSGKSSSTIHLREIVHINLARGWRGGEKQTYLLIKSLSEAGYSQVLITSRGSPLSDRTGNLRNIRIITPVGAFISKFTAPSIIHAHEARAVYIAYFLNRLYDLPYIITRRMDRPPKNRYLTKRAYSRASRLVAISNATKKQLNNFLPNKKVSIIPSAHSNTLVDIDKSQKLKEHLLGNNDYLIGHAGALVDSDKGQTILIEAATRLEEEGFRISLIFMGQGKDYDLLRRKAGNLKSVFFPGQISKITNYLAALDIFVFPSRNEGLGSVLIDVMRCNVPIIASDTGGIPDLITDGINGILVPVGRPEQLAEEIKNLLDSKEKREAIANNAYKTAKNFSPKVMAEKYINIYTEISQVK